MPRIDRLFSVAALTVGLLLGTTAHAETGHATATHAAAAKRKVIIDDDGFALMQAMLVESGDVDVLGLTSVSGDLWANRVTAMDLRGLELAGRSDIPVSAGATFPLVNTEAQTERWEALYGKLTWKGAWMKNWVEPTQQATPPYYGPNDPVTLAWGDPAHKPTGELAANFLIRMVHKYPGEVTIVACGPMTNLALAQRLDPQFASLAKELVYMGGSFNPRQVLDNRSAADFAREFTNSPRREFNIRFDPEAASIVSRAPWRHITVVPADPSTATQQTPELIERLAKVASPDLARLIRSLPTGFPMWDEIAAAVFLDPTLVKQHERLYVDYETQFGPSYGDTLSWREHYQPGLGEQPADVIETVDVPRMEALIERLMARSRKP
ncbi:Inosine-uridine preferring nucleoside hydrolase [Novosphingobium nitrogenifigens DSM 19370]|uniref:Inosine-uridine preferring nucleoside hydrolase n=1 Tax=Novosphingobium nitrogenifigens DSM 19370 TaxID=983920 RepID=F1ZAP1_9SPHN|nr:nucleoside hydrolase [Novosphingobium nitrogenifigens]EGD58322.1 Inosine-uridine preferring nucleoside hydrolase [Novosphingobium nitrogenifigens DSM 19370]